MEGEFVGGIRLPEFCGGNAAAHRQPGESEDHRH
jgi:hypothetical protein